MSVALTASDIGRREVEVEKETIVSTLVSSRNVELSLATATCVVCVCCSWLAGMLATSSPSEAVRGACRANDGVAAAASASVASVAVHLLGSAIGSA